MNNRKQQFKDVSMRFLDICKRIVRITPAKKKALFVAIPTTSGTGSEVTPFAVVTDNKDNIKYPAGRLFADARYCDC